MAKGTSWFRRLLGLKNSRSPDKPPSTKKWSLLSSYREKMGHNHCRHVSSIPDSAKQIVAPALISNQAHVITDSTHWASVKIQSAFRAYLARRALKALKGLVKLQAVVRGYIVRKNTADYLRRMHSLLRAQSRARALRAQNSDSLLSSTKSAKLPFHGPATPEKFEQAIRARSMKHGWPSTLNRSGSNEKSRMGSKRSDHQTPPSLYCEAQSRSPLKQYHETEESSLCSAENTPHYIMASSNNSRMGPFTPTENGDSRSYISGYWDHPNYMACTKSSRAKARSVSAPKQRPQYERSVSTKRNLNYAFGDRKEENGQKVSMMHANFTNKAYPGSGMLDRFGMPVGVRNEGIAYNGFYESKF